MKAAVMVKTNAPLEIRDIPKPKPQNGQVLIKIHASGVCGTDLHVLSGLMPVPLPLVLGHEPVGEIVEVGPGVVDLKVGDRVGVCWAQKGCGHCPYCIQKRYKYCGFPTGAPQSWVNLGGGNAEYMVAWEEGCTILPEGLDYALAAPLFCGGYTIASGLFNAKARPGDKVAVLGLGGLGHLAIQFAKAKGHHVVVVTRNKDKAPLAKKLGADEVVIASSDIGKALLEIGGVDIILHVSNSSKMASDAIDGLLPEGRLVVMGLDSNAINIPPFKLLVHQKKVIGSMQNERRDLVDILEEAAKGKVIPMIETYPLEEINTVFDKLKNDQVHFRAVLKIT